MGGREKRSGKYLEVDAYVMKSLFASAFFTILMSGAVAQERLTYLETNLGLSYAPEVVIAGDVWPGVSFLYGGQIFRPNGAFLDVQYGLAIPTVVTMKIGAGFKNQRTGRSVSAGARIWPAHLCLQFGFPNPRCSQEVSAKMKKRLERRGSDCTHLLFGEWNVSLEAGMGHFDRPLGLKDSHLEFGDLSFLSSAILTFSHRWYFE